MLTVGVCALALAGCGGGGGINSTPTPIGPVSLVEIKASQALTTTAATAIASFPLAGGAPTIAVAPHDMTLTVGPGDSGYYTYTTTVAGRTLKYITSDIDTVPSNAKYTVYVKPNGTTTDTLTVTKPGKGNSNYQYVGAGYQQHQVAGVSATDATLDTFLFGFKSPVGAIPRTGYGSYDVDLLGAQTTATAVLNMRGTGTMAVNFDAGTVVTTGTFRAGTSNVNSIFSSEARITSGNAFAGNFRYEDVGPFSGTLTGSFFGPTAEEIGAAFSASQADGRIAIGTLVGRGATVTAGNVSFSKLTQDEFFTNDAVELKASIAQDGNKAAVSAGSTPLVVFYDDVLDRYSLVTSDRSAFFKSLAQSSGTSTDTLTISTLPGLQYLRGGQWRQTVTGAGTTQYTLDDFTYGMETPDAALPRTGQAGFAAVLSGSAVDGNYAGIVNVTGRGLLTADFGTGVISAKGGAHYAEDGSIDPAEVVNGMFTLTGSISSGANLFSGTVSLTGIGDYTGSASGRFYGPIGDEFGSVLALTNGHGGVISGQILAQVDKQAFAAQTGLDALTAPRRFKDIRYVAARGGVARFMGATSLLTYDPASQNYTFATLDDTVPPSTQTFGAAALLPAQSDASFARYASSNIEGQSINAAIFKTAAGNPAINLTYTSFADITVTLPDNGATAIVQYIFPFGIDTPAVQIPQFGVGSYSGIVYGRGRVVDPSSTTSNYALSGTSALEVDFGAATFTNILAVSGTDLQSQAEAALGTFTARGTINALGGLVGDFGTNGASSYRGGFYGANAAEFGSAFLLRNTDAGGVATSLYGVTVGKKN